MKQLWYFVISFLLCVNSFAAIVDNKSVIVVINDPPPSTKKSFLNVEATSIAISPFYQYLGLGISYERHILGDWHWTVLDYHKFDHQGTNTESDLKKDFKKINNKRKLQIYNILNGCLKIKNHFGVRLILILSMEKLNGAQSMLFLLLV